MYIVEWHKGQAYVALGIHTDLEVEHHELKESYAMAQTEIDNAWSQYHAAMAEYDLCRQTRDRERLAFSALCTEHTKDIILRDHYKRQLDALRLQHCERIVNGT